jgi:hypothetical protein
LIGSLFVKSFAKTVLWEKNVKRQIAECCGKTMFCLDRFAFWKKFCKNRFTGKESKTIDSGVSRQNDVLP